MRYQTAYGKILELAQTAFYVTIPETETLYGGDILDFYRLQSGAVHLSGKKTNSIEASAEMNGRGGEGDQFRQLPADLGRSAVAHSTGHGLRRQSDCIPRLFL